MSANQDLEAQRLTSSDFALPETPVLVPKAAQPTGDAAQDPPLPDVWAPTAPRPSVLKRAYDGANRSVGAIVQRFTLPEDDAPVDFFGKLISFTPPWLISLIIHFSLMIMLGLAVFGANSVVQKEIAIEVDLSHQRDNEVYAETLGEQLTDPSAKFSSDGLEPSKDTAAALATSDLPEVEHPLVGPPVLEPSPGGTLPVGTVPTPTIALEFSGREEGFKKTLIKAYGGTALTEDSVRAGLAWLVRQQRTRGSWSMQGPYKSGANMENEEAATAMALIAFQGAGYTTTNAMKNDTYTRVVSRAWKWLIQREQSDGHFFANLTPEQHQLYTQALCTIALCELYGMTHDESYLEPAQRAVDYCVKIQSPEGGWRYQPGVDSDLSVTGWFAMAMQSARMAGVEVPSPVFERIGKFLDTVARDEGARYGYQFNQGATKPLTAEGLLSRQYLGWAHDDQRLRNGVDYLLANLPNWNDRNVYYWYYGTQVCHHMEGKEWQKWNAVMRQLLPEHQEKRGPERGSWDPNGDRWGGTAGRLYVTCLSLYTLEVYYRHLPIYQRNAMTSR